LFHPFPAFSPGRCEETVFFEIDFFCFPFEKKGKKFQPKKFPNKISLFFQHKEQDYH